MLRVGDLAQAAEPWLRPEDFCRRTHVRGTRNAHLAEPRERGLRSGRSMPLPLDAEVYGDFITVSYDWHDHAVVLADYHSLAEVEAAILSGAGILNSFNEFMLAFVAGRQRGYEVRDDSGRLWAKEGVRTCGVEALDAFVLNRPNRPACRVTWGDGKRPE
jgi:hypothetical protein